MIYVVAAFIEKDRKILITKRSSGTLKGMWEFPGGKVEVGESKTEAIKREIFEELSLEIIPINEIGDYYFKYSFNEINLTLIQCEIKNKKFKIISDGSHLEFKWILLKEANKYSFTPLDEKILLSLKNY